MLEDWIARQYRKARDARRERIARRYDAEAHLEEVVADTYRICLALSTGLEANFMLQHLAKRGLAKHSAAAREARQRAADVRAGRRRR